MKKIVKSPKKQSAKITKLKMRVGEIANMLLQNNPKMVRMRSGGSSGYADLFMSKQLMKGGMNGTTQTAIVEFLNKDENKEAVKALKEKLLDDLDEYLNGEQDKDKLIKIIDNTKLEIYNKNLYEYKIDNLYEQFMSDYIDKDVEEDLITLDIVQKFYLLVQNKYGEKIITDGYIITKPGNEEVPSPSVVALQAIEEKVANAIEERDRLIEERDRLIEEQELKDSNKLEITDESKNILADVFKKIEEAEAKLAELQKTAAGAQGGKPPAKYKSTGRIVHIMYKKRNYKRTVYVKGKRNTKYCKIDGEYILLSKMKMIA